MDSFLDTIKNLQEKCKTFDTMVTRLKDLNSDLATRSDKLVQQISELLGNKPCTKQCQVCYSRPITIAWGCGHCICESCAERCKRRNPPRCYTCRTVINSQIKLYL